jgi:putative ABC transport system ATP-binding protein
MTTSTSPVIEFRQVGLTYPGPPPVPALRPSDLRIDHGEYVAVIGPSGSGKSTFLNVAGLLDGPTAGSYLFDGFETGSLRDAERTALRGRRIGFVFQSFHLLAYRSALENVLLAMVYRGRRGRTTRTAEARGALSRVGLEDRIHAQPPTLSGGERQRVAIARALVTKPSLLLCDEPTGNLDSRTTETLLELLDTLHSDGMTIVVITHDPLVAARATRTLAMRDGLLSQAPT